MATTDVTIPYEILVRFDTTGAIAGAHYQTRRVVTVDGTQLVDQVGEAQSLDIASAGDGRTTLQSVLGDALTSALANVATLTTSAQAAQDQIASLQAQIAALTAAEHHLT
jgi:hypothetical protein